MISSNHQKIFYCLFKLLNGIDGLNDDIHAAIVKSKDKTKINNLFVINDLMIQVDTLQEDEIDYEPISELLFKNNSPQYIRTIDFLNYIIDELKNYSIRVFSPDLSNLQYFDYDKSKNNILSSKYQFKNEEFNLYMILSCNYNQINLAILDENNIWNIYSNQNSLSSSINNKNASDKLQELILDENHTKLFYKKTSNNNTVFSAPTHVLKHRINNVSISQFFGVGIALIALILIIKLIGGDQSS
ncbi:hypothetical protein TVAG_067460 [Trichomonas vaginalis G3]|uniref:Uncharacterized protein n=1 Tax=Trichomonas vaginalis (strain ATCC PRA-98 / G3) TaxID=412133 RepID=A2DSG2_TRIV3|nr:hypothetical protein TVAGG3_0080050 [Trichomonas vaginalis G3]EAY16741.1 hypothetical protein TVAG_067460 [Trichomonas vaginalis G3]KAI5543182.1 hypothetical protein TVAGG3_0080050 [Trichomonas vaginalis G3]|eukprot:XP_001328964.1 hypothetical protein [Trichomonas vaginalis G3]